MNRDIEKLQSLSKRVDAEFRSFCDFEGYPQYIEDVPLKLDFDAARSTSVEQDVMHAHALHTIIGLSEPEAREAIKTAKQRQAVVKRLVAEYPDHHWLDFLRLRVGLDEALIRKWRNRDLAPGDASAIFRKLRTAFRA